jgi:hypothetical protein
MPPQNPVEKLNPGEEVQTTSARKKEQTGKQRRIHNFIRWEREKQVQTFLSWLPQELADAPGIDWTTLSADVMGYCVRTIGDSPDAAVLAVAAASMQGAVGAMSQAVLLRRVYALLRSLHATTSMQHLADLEQEQIWFTWAEQQDKTEATRGLLAYYTAISTGHFLRYLRRLSVTERQRMQQYALPSPPKDIMKRYFPFQKLHEAQQAKRKATTDILVPLYPVLRQLVRFRKQLAERMLLAFREACTKAGRGEAILPYHFQYVEALPEVNRDARSIAEVQIQGREVVMKFVLWDKRTWVEHHDDHYRSLIVKRAKQGQAAYNEDQNCFFVEFDGPPSDLLWFGDLVEQRVLQRFVQGSFPGSEEYQKRWQYARQLGFSNGCACCPTGLLSPGEHWFALAAERGKTLVFEPESLYRGVLYGAALAMLALSNGSRMSELLQVSWNKERRVTRTETVVLLAEDGQPKLGDDGKPLTKQVKLHFQHLLPKGAKTEEERQLFPLSKEAMRLLGEIKTLLETTHGEIPVVAPSRSNGKYDDLKPERYLFQWDATPDGQHGILSSADVQVLLRFILHGLDLSTAQGKPIHITTHVLRHVMATHARHYRHVPPEAIAYFFLHHRLKELTGQTSSLTDVSAYYTLMTEEQRFAVIGTDLDEQEEMDHTLLQTAPTPRDLEQMNEDLRAVFELWHALHPTALGNCGCPGLCPRGNDRALCLGCSYLVTDPERMGAALVWRESYAKQAELLEAQGNVIDARQARIKVQQLDDVLNVMRLQFQAEADGSYIPLHKALRSPYQKVEESREETG